MMKNLLLQEGDLVTLKNVSLAVATYTKFKPQAPDFLDISNPKAVYPLSLLGASFTRGLGPVLGSTFAHKCSQLKSEILP